ncbi:MAG: hypothetical protein Q4G58_05825 [bacterium]|nr:hypothetical protein [bacterium]
MQCKIEEFELNQVTSRGAPKKVIVDEFEWLNGGEQGKTYTYRMSSERFERTNKKAYRIIVVEDSGKECPVATMTYYDFVDFSIEDCIGDRLIEQIAKEMNTTAEKVWEVIKEKLDDLKAKIRFEFEQTEEYLENKKNQQIIENYKKAKKKFSLELGVDQAKYDHIYNVFGELKDADYLNKVHEQIKEREKFSQNSKRKNKEAWRNFSGSSDFFGGGKSSYSEEDKDMLSKFYKVLAKKFHPDANPGIDTSKEMQLLNEIKKDWGV